MPGGQEPAQVAPNPLSSTTAISQAHGAEMLSSDQGAQQQNQLTNQLADTAPGATANPMNPAANPMNPDMAAAQNAMAGPDAVESQRAQDVQGILQETRKILEATQPQNAPEESE